MNQDDDMDYRPNRSKIPRQLRPIVNFLNKTIVQLLFGVICVGTLLGLSIYLAVMRIEKGDAIPESDKLTFQTSGLFKIVQFTDLHFGDNNTLDEKTLKVQRDILDIERPDLVIMTGDSVSGNKWDKREVGWFEKQYRKLVQPMIDANIPWALALGNHDTEADLNGEKIVLLDRSISHLSKTQMGPDSVSGVTNYRLSVFSNDKKEIKAHLWIFDSGTQGCYGAKGWGCIHSDQVTWYLDNQEADNTPTQLAFFHIPPQEFMNVWNFEQTYGRLEAGAVCCSALNTGIFAAFKSTGKIRGVFCGMDHNNDYSGQYHNITLAYGRKTGYGSSGPPPNWYKGARVIQIDNQLGVTSWIREENGKVFEAPTHLPNGGSNETFLCCGASD
jgi:hypothetical protein